ncbi:MAG: hypothetical protein Q8K37_01425 [Alphaproteobacteria bacterium]|nr:hypothetical protein [Alphaproteobacteria bacterium]
MTNLLLCTTNFERNQMNDTDKKKERLAVALRENLKKRKIQQHARIKNTLITPGQDTNNEIDETLADDNIIQD